MENANVMNFIWETKDGRKIRLKDMSESHLLNTFRLVQRKTGEFAEALDHYPCFQGEMAQFHAERMYDMASEKYQCLKSTLKIISRACELRKIKL